MLITMMATLIHSRIETKNHKLTQKNHKLKQKITKRFRPGLMVSKLNRDKNGQRPQHPIPASYTVRPPLPRISCAAWGGGGGGGMRPTATVPVLTLTVVLPCRTRGGLDLYLDRSLARDACTVPHSY
jgi:hypothetical protein